MEGKLPSGFTDNKMENSPRWKGGKPKCIDCEAQLVTYSAIRCISCNSKYHARIGSKNSNWKGDNVGYIALHDWVDIHMPDIKECMYCGSEDSLQWANISRKYKRDLSDWMRLCRGCHRRYDGQYKLEKFELEEIKNLYKQGFLQQTIAKKYNVSASSVSRIVNYGVSYHKKGGVGLSR